MNNWGYNVSGGGGSSSPLTFPDSGVVNALAIMPGAINILDGYIFTVTGIIASNTGATTISINNGSPINIVGMNNLALQGGELTASFDAEFLLNSAGTATLLGTSNGSLPIKGGTQTNQAINYGQLQGAITTILAETLQTNNNLSEIEARGATAQNAAKANLAIPSPSTFLQVSNLLSEIEALGPTAQETAQTNLGVSTAGFLQVANLLSEIAALGAPDQATALANLGGQKSGLSLLIANYLSEISAAGSVAQTSARNNIGAQQAGVSLLTANNLSEIEAAGPLAQSAAQTNLGISLSGYLKTSNNLSEIAAAGPTAQSSARTNIGAQQTGLALLIANLFSEIAALGSASQATARTNLGIILSNFLQASNNLSDVANAATARNNLGAQQSGLSLLIANNLSEIAVAGSAAQAAAQANLGISSGGGSAGELLGVALITSSQTFTLLTGTNTIIAEIVGGGSASAGTSTTSSLQYSASTPGCPGVYGKLEFKKSLLSTESNNTIIITIGAGGGVGTGGGASTIDSPAIISCGGGAASAATAAQELGTSTTPLLVPKTLNSSGVTSMVLTVASNVTILSSKNVSGIDWITDSPLTGWISSTMIFKPDSTSNVTESGYASKTYFPIDYYGKGGSSEFAGTSNASVTGQSGTAGAVLLYMYS